MKSEFRRILSSTSFIVIILIIPAILITALVFDYPKAPNIGGYAYRGKLNFSLQTIFLYLCFAIPVLNNRFAKNWLHIRIQNLERVSVSDGHQILNVGIFVYLIFQTSYALAFRKKYLNDLDQWMNLNENKIFILLLLTIATIGLVRSNFSSQKLGLLPIINLFLLAIALSLKNTNLELHLNRYIFAISAVLILWAGLFFRFGSSESTSRTTDYIVILPTISFLTFANVSTSYSLHPYESMSFSNFQLFSDGQQPWKNFELEHGIWTDLLRNVIASTFANDQSFWSMSYVYGFMVRPIEVLFFLTGLRLLTQSIFKTIVVFISLRMIDIFFGLAFWNSPQTTPILFITYLLYMYLKTSDQKYIYMLGFSLGISMIWAPETIYSIVAVMVTLMIFSFTNLRYQVKQLLVLSSIAVLTIFALLQPFSLFFPYLKSNITIGNGYNFAWADNFHFELGPIYSLLVLLVPVTALYFLSNIQFARRSEYSALHKAMLAPLIVCVFFYWKFLQWPDWHIYTPAVILILIVLIAATLTRFRFELQNGLSGFIVVLILISPMLYKPNAMLELPETKLEKDFQLANEPSKNYISRINAVYSSFSPFLKQANALYDFGNEPITWYGYLNFPTATSISKVLNANSFQTEEMLINELRSNPYAAVVWGSEYGYSNFPFGPTFVRKPVIASFILENFSPVAIDGKYVLFMRKGLFPINEAALMELLLEDCSLRFDLNRVDYNQYLIRNKSKRSNQIVIPNPQNKYNYVLLGPNMNRFFLNTKKMNTEFVIDFSYCPAWIYSTDRKSWNLEKTENDS